MVKNILSILLSFVLLISAGLFEHFYLKTQFNEMDEALTTYYQKTENQTSTTEDGKVVGKLWEEKKKTLHILIPHTSITYVDYWLTEATGLIGQGKYDLALPKLEVLLKVIEGLPATYEPTLENVL